MAIQRMVACFSFPGLVEGVGFCGVIFTGGLS